VLHDDYNNPSLNAKLADAYAASYTVASANAWIVGYLA